MQILVNIYFLIQVFFQGFPLENRWSSASSIVMQIKGREHQLHSERACYQAMEQQLVISALDEPAATLVRW